MIALLLFLICLIMIIDHLYTRKSINEIYHRLDDIDDAVFDFYKEFEDFKLEFDFKNMEDSE